MTAEKKSVLLGVTGSIAAYRAADLVRSMRVGDVALLVSACQIGPVRD